MENFKKQNDNEISWIDDFERIDFNNDDISISKYGNDVVTEMNKVIHKIFTRLNECNHDYSEDDLIYLEKLSMKLYGYTCKLFNVIKVGKSDELIFIEKINHSNNINETLFERLKLNIFNLRITELELINLKANAYLDFIKDISLANYNNAVHKLEF